MCFQRKFPEPGQPSDYEKDIDALASEGYNIHHQICHRRQRLCPTQGSPSCNDTVKDCCSDGGLTNLTSLMFAEDQVRFLAAGMSRSGFVCSISNMKTLQTDR
jgi:hypothetical protein